MKIAAGGAAAHTEVVRMIIEKASACAEAATLPRAASKLRAKTKQTIGGRENKRSGGRGPDRTPRHRRTKQEIGRGADFFKAQENRERQGALEPGKVFGVVCVGPLAFAGVVGVRTIEKSRSANHPAAFLLRAIVVERARPPAVAKHQRAPALLNKYQDSLYATKKSISVIAQEPERVRRSWSPCIPRPSSSGFQLQPEL
jgi:hypothetical protein